MYNVKLKKSVFIVTLLIVIIFSSGCNYTPKCEDELVKQTALAIGQNLAISSDPSIIANSYYKDFYIEGARILFYDFGIDRYVCTANLNFKYFRRENSVPIYYEVTTDSTGEPFVELSFEDRFSRESNNWLGIIRYFTSFNKTNKKDTFPQDKINYKKLSKKLKVPKDCLKGVVTYYYAEYVGPKEMVGCTPEDLKKIYANWEKIITEE